MADETKENEPDYAQNRQTLKDRKVSNAVCEVEGCSEKATFGERSDVHGLCEHKRCKGHKDNFTYYNRLKWTVEATVKLVVFVGAVMTSPETVRLWAFDTVKRDTRIPLTCREHDRQYDQALVDLMGGRNGCGECNGNLQWSERVPELVKKIEKRRYTLDETEASLKRGLEEDGCDYKLKLICPNGHAYYSGTVNEFTGKHQRGCMTCAGNVPWSKRVPELMDIISGREYTLDESEASLKKGLEKDRQKYKLKLICPNGHKYSSGTVNDFANGQHGCSTCTDPRTEKLVREWLDEQFSDKFRKVRPDFLLYPETGRNLELDLFCTELKLAFEIDGAQHNEYFPGHFHKIREKENNTFDNTNLWHPYQIRPGEPPNDRLFIHQQNKDRFKDKKCKEEGIYLIRIDGRSYNYMDPEKLFAHLEEQIENYSNK
jgi:hypothetical protein